MPDVEIAAGPSNNVRFIVDIVAAKDLVASLVVAETFPVEQYRLRIKNGKDSDALLAGIRSYTLLRLRELVPGSVPQALCGSSLPGSATRCYARNKPNGMTKREVPGLPLGRE